MPIDIGVGGAWKDMANLNVGVGGAWKQVSRAWIGVGGVWKDLWTYFNAALAASYTFNDNAVTPANAASGIKLDSDGQVYRLNGSTYTSVGTWLTGGGTSADYEGRWTTSTGSLSSGASGVWENLGTDQGWSRNNNSDTPGAEVCTGTLEIRMAAAPNTVFTSSSVSLTATVDA